MVGFLWVFDFPEARRPVNTYALELYNYLNSFFFKASRLINFTNDSVMFVKLQFIDSSAPGLFRDFSSSVLNLELCTKCLNIATASHCSGVNIST